MATRKPTRRPVKARPAAGTAAPVWLLLFGVLFGYFLSKSGATDTDTILGMFLFTDLRLYGVIAMAVAVIALGLFILRRKSKTMEKSVAAWDDPPIDRKRLIGAFVFGAGWALAGICPGTVFAQLGEGKWSALFALAGLVAGVWAYLQFGPRSKK